MKSLSLPLTEWGIIEDVLKQYLTDNEDELATSEIKEYKQIINKVRKEKLSTENNPLKIALSDDAICIIKKRVDTYLKYNIQNITVEEVRLIDAMVETINDVYTTLSKVYPFNIEIQYDPQCDEDGSEDYYHQSEWVTAYDKTMKDAMVKASEYAEKQFGPRVKNNSTLVAWTLSLSPLPRKVEPKILK